MGVSCCESGYNERSNGCNFVQFDTSNDETESEQPPQEKGARSQVYFDVTEWMFGFFFSLLKNVPVLLVLFFEAVFLNLHK